MPLPLMFSAVRQFLGVEVWVIAMLNLPLAAFRSGVREHGGRCGCAGRESKGDAVRRRRAR